MEMAGIGSDRFGHRGDKGDHIVFDFGFQRFNSFGIDFGLFPDDRNRLFGNTPLSLPSLARQNFDGQPQAPPRLIRPEPTHFRARVS